MKPKKVNRSADVDYPSMADYSLTRRDVIKRVAATAGLAAVAGFGLTSAALAGEKVKGKAVEQVNLKGEVAQPRPAKLRGDVAAPQPADKTVKGKVKAPTDPKQAEPETCEVKPLTKEQTVTAEKLIAQLGDEKFKVREAASTKLFEMGPAVVAVLEGHKEDKDPEVRTRVAALIEKFNAPKTVEKVHRIERPAIGGLMVAPQPVPQKELKKQ